MIPRLTCLSLVVAALAAFGCASGAASRASDSGAPANATKGEPLRMAIQDYRSGATFELVNRSHTDPIEQYSKVRPDASRKVQEDQVVQALRDWLMDQGFAKYARPGHAPILDKGTKAWALEIEGQSGASYIYVTPETPPNDVKAMRDMREAVLATYNATQGYQAVDIKTHGKDYFNTQQPPAGKKP